MLAAVATCYYCALPIGGQPLRAMVAEQEQHFCCTGCLMIFRLAGQSGEAGQTTILTARLVVGFLFGMVVMATSWSSYLNDLLGAQASSSQAAPAFAAVATPDPMDTFLFRLYVPLAAAIVLVVLGQPIFVGAWRGLRDKLIGLDVLIVLGVGAAYVKSIGAVLTGAGHTYFDTATAILLLVTIGRLIEARAKVRTVTGARAIFDLQPLTAILVANDREETVRCDRLEPGMTIRVRPGDRFPVDGVLLEGETAVNEAALTGEEAPVAKRPGDAILAGTVNLDGVVLVRVERTGEYATIGRIARLLDEARKTRSPLVRLADRLATYLTMLATTLAAAGFLYWTVTEGPERGLLVALSVLLIACPCALGIATPLAIWAGLGEAAHHGALVRGGEVLERLAKIDRVFFDKTGTITTGALRLVGVRPLSTGQDLVPESDTKRELLRRAAALSRWSSHPIANAVMASADRETLPSVSGVRAFSGLGSEGYVGDDERPSYFGSLELMHQMGLTFAAESDEPVDRVNDFQATSAYLGWDGLIRAEFSFTGDPRPEVHDALAELHSDGIKAAVLTGDSEGPALALMAQIGLPREVVYSGLRPEDKVKAIADAGQRGERTVMVGDGINDGPALAAADVGMAIGCGTDLAREAADVIFVGADLRHVPAVLRLARRVRRTILVNLFWAVTYNAIGLALALAGLLAPWMAALAMVLSSVFVLGNSLRARNSTMWIDHDRPSREDTEAER